MYQLLLLLLLFLLLLPLLGYSHLQQHVTDQLGREAGLYRGGSTAGTGWVVRKVQRGGLS